MQGERLGGILGVEVEDEGIAMAAALLLSYGHCGDTVPGGCVGAGSGRVGRGGGAGDGRAEQRELPEGVLVRNGVVGVPGGGNDR